MPFNYSIYGSKTETKTGVHKEIIFILVSFLSINAVLVTIYFVLPNVIDVFRITQKTLRYETLRRTFTCFQFTFSIFSTLINLASVWICWHSKYLSKSIHLLLLMDSVARSIYSALLALAFYCMISEFIFKDEERSGSFFGVSFAQCSGLLKQIYIWGQRMFSSFGYISMFLQLTLTLNRFLALSFDGRYFHRVQQHERLQVLVPCLIGFVTKEWLEKLFGVRITLVAATISLDFMLIYKMWKTQRVVAYSSEQFLLAQIIVNNVPYAYSYLLCPFIYVTFNEWLPWVSDFFFYVGNLLMYAGGLFFQGLTNVYLLKKAMKRGLERASRRALVQRACSDTQSCSTSKK